MMNENGEEERLLQVKGLRTEFSGERGSFTAVDDVSFSISKGRTLCLVGESGSGKSVTSLSIMRLIEKPGEITGGEVKFFGADLLRKPSKEMQKIRGKDISMIFQDPMTGLNPCYTVGFQIKEVIKIHQKLTRKELHDRAVEALRLVAVPLPEERLKTHPFRLSGGLRQRVMAAMAMACQPQLLIADEPTTALDVTIQAQVLELINALKEKEGAAVLFITHDLGVVAEMADHVAVMYAGKIVEKGEAKEVLQNPRHPYTEGLLRSLPSKNRGRRKSRLFNIPGNVPTLRELPAGCAFWPRCSRAAELCREQKPEIREAIPGHEVSCFKVQGVI